ncbi:hypothetical protein J6590_029357 [Homalodisca vitripennis]|nr:hypothetical protein J6590_029357 [Homalodisca vitripennis]
MVAGRLPEETFESHRGASPYNSKNFKLPAAQSINSRVYNLQPVVRKGWEGVLLATIVFPLCHRPAVILLQYHKLSWE